jgi:hypothetical protein
MPLPYHVTDELDLTQLTYNSDDIATLIVTGGRYGGDWALNALAVTDGRPSETPIGSIMTDRPGHGPGMAFDTAYVWVNDACVKAGVKLAHGADKNDERPVEERPYFATGLFLIDRRP